MRCDKEGLSWKGDWTSFVLLFSDPLNKVINEVKDSILSNFNNEYCFLGFKL